MAFFEKFIYKEERPDLKRPWIRPVSILTGLLTSCVLAGIVSMFGSYDVFNSLCAYFQSSPERKIFFYVFVFFTAFGIIYRAYYAVAGIIHHDKKTGLHLDDRYVTFCIGSNIVVNLTMVVVFVLTGTILWMFGFNFIGALGQVFDFNYIFKKVNLLIDKTPTLFHFNYFVTLILAYIIPSLANYTWHRISHQSRLLWLLAHRNHHTSTTLSAATAFEADPKFPLGQIWNMIIRIIIPGLISKLFYDKVLFVELAFCQMLWGMMEIHNHTSAYYEDMRTSKFFWPLMVITGSGPYHIVHHSADPKHTKANLGLGCFLIWDRLFGTYVHPPMKLPKLGLTNQPEIYLNPVNYTFSGLLQILYELKHNAGLSMKFKILFGNIYFLPPKTKSYMLKDENTYYQMGAKVAEV